MFIKLENVSYRFENNFIFKSIGVTIGSGNLVMLTGKNGSGKTSLLKIIADEIQNYDGKVEIEGETSLAYLHNKTCLIDEISCEENLLYWADIYESHEKIAAIINYLKLEDILELECKYLSSGQTKRLELARLMLSNANIWLLDEPETNLDLISQELLINLLYSRVNQKGIVIVATNNPVIYKSDIHLNMEDFQENV